MVGYFLEENKIKQNPFKIKSVALYSVVVVRRGFCPFYEETETLMDLDMWWQFYDLCHKSLQLR